MKHLKRFENYYDPKWKSCYWYVPTKDGKLYIALKKIGASDKFINGMVNRVGYLPDYIYVGEYMKQGNWLWDNDRDNFEKINTMYMGEVKVDKLEVTADKFNL